MTSRKWGGSDARQLMNRPNRIGSTMCEVLGRTGRTLVVAELDAINGAPVLETKPVMAEFLPCEAIRQPPWATELMARYWHKG